MRLYLPRNSTLVSNLLVNDKITALYRTNNKRYKQQSDVEKLFGLQVSKNQICNPFQSSIRLRIHLEAGPPTV